MITKSYKEDVSKYYKGRSNKYSVTKGRPNKIRRKRNKLQITVKMLTYLTVTILLRTT